LTVHSYQPPPLEEAFDITIFVAVYNEEKYVEHALDTMRTALGIVGLTYDVVVIDDASTDRSGEIVERWRAAHPEVQLQHVRRSKNRGLAAGFVDAAFLGRGKYYRLMCGDDPEPLESMVELMRHVGEADMVLPYYPRIPGKSRFRRDLSKVYTRIVNTISGHEIRYYNGCGIHRRYNVMRWGPYSFGFGFQAELVTRLLDEGNTFLEIPLDVVHRNKDKKGSALNVRNFLSVTHSLSDIMARRIRRKAWGT
jgi:glycosyltransferase involved in cell wall biosynthesis